MKARIIMTLEFDIPPDTSVEELREKTKDIQAELFEDFTDIPGGTTDVKLEIFE